MQQSGDRQNKKSAGRLAGETGFFRRMAAVCYDTLLLLAVLFFATAILLPLNSGHAFSSNQFFYPIYLASISFIFFCWFWTHGGQTLGLRSWKIKVCGFDGRPIGWRRASLRYLAALLSWMCLGLGFLWGLVDKKGLCWHDYLSKTRLYRAGPENG